MDGWTVRETDWQMGKGWRIDTRVGRWRDGETAEKTEVKEGKRTKGLGAIRYK